jgi:LVIVD repeat
MLRPRAAPILVSIALCGCRSGLVCGTNSVEVDGVCVGEGGGTYTVTNTLTVPNTETNTIYVDTDPILTPGDYPPVFSELKKVLGAGGAVGTAGAGQTHMHTFDIKYRDGYDDPLNLADRPPEMVNCSYTLSVVNAFSPESMPYLAQGYVWPAAVDTNPLDTFKPRAPGCHRLAFDEVDPDIIYTTMHGNLDDGPGFLSAVDLNHSGGTTTTVKLAPVLGPQLLEGLAPEGVDFENGLVWVALHDDGIAVYHRDVDGPDNLLATTDDHTMVRDAGYTTNLTDSRDVTAIGDLLYVGDGVGGVKILDISDPLAPVELSAVVTGGIAHDIELNAAGTHLYVALQSGGWSILDVSDPLAPQILSNTLESSSVVAIAEDAGWVSVAAWNDTRVYNVADPSNPARLGGVRIEVPKAYTGDEGERPDITGRTLATDIHGDILYNGDWWTPYTHYIHKDVTASPYIYLPETYAQITFPGDLAVGETSDAVTLDVYNYGTADLTLYDNWIDNPAFTVTPWQAVVPPGGKVTLTMTFTATQEPVAATGDTGAPALVEETGLLHIRSDDPLFPDRTAYLAGNKAGISVGDPFPEDMAGLLVDNTSWSYEANSSGDVLLFAYFATF